MLPHLSSGALQGGAGAGWGYEGMRPRLCKILPLSTTVQTPSSQPGREKLPMRPDAYQSAGHDAVEGVGRRGSPPVHPSPARRVCPDVGASDLADAAKARRRPRLLCAAARIAVPRMSMRRAGAQQA
eukprot:362721-Chlamydomonas_euryale.AAC.11